MDIVEISTSCVVCVCFQGWLGVYYGLDLLFSKLSKAPVAESFVSGTLSISGTIVFPLKGHGNEPDFPRFGIGPLHYISSRSDFGFEFSEIFLFEKRLPDSTIRGVSNSLYQRYAESTTLRLNDTGSQRLSASLIRGVDDSPHHRYRECSTTGKPTHLFRTKCASLDSV